MTINTMTKRMATAALGFAAFASLQLSAPLARANEKLIALSKNNENWVMPGRDYDSDNYSPDTQINTNNVKNLKAAWSFSTGALNGHEGAPLVVNGKIYINTPYPNAVFALDLDNPGKILWQYKPKQDAAARSVACCDLVNRGLAYWPGDAKTPPLILSDQLDGHVVALKANTGELFWKIENADVKVGSTLTAAPFVVKDEVVVGASGAELGIRGYVTAYDVHDGAMKWRKYATGPDSEVGIGDDFNKANPQYGQKGLGLSTWEGDAWKIGGGTNWGWYAYDSNLNLIYYGSGNGAPWNASMRPGDNKWTNAIFARDADTGEAKFGYQRTPHDEWDYSGVNNIILSDGKVHKLLTEPDRNGFIYSLDRTDGSLFGVQKIDETMNVFKGIDFKNGQPIRDPEYATYMNHRSRGICPSAMGYHNQAHDSYDPRKQLLYINANHICMDWEPFMVPYRAGQFFVGATLDMYPGPKGDPKEGLGTGQIKAFDVIHGRFKWQVQERFAAWGGSLSTAGNLLFYGTLDGYIKARDADTGKLLWKFKLPSGVVGYPITYEHRGIQYIAINYGVGGWPGVGLVFDLQDPEDGSGSVGAFAALGHWTQQGGGVMVFSLNGKSPYTENVNLDEYSAVVRGGN